MSLLGISLGDPTGIGPEVALKALAALPATETRYLLIGDAELANELNRRLQLGLSWQPFKPRDQQERILFLHSPAPTSGMTKGSAEAARAALSWLRQGTQLALERKIDALVTAPLNKEAVVGAGIPFVGQTELLSELAGTKRTAMMLLGHDDRGRWLRVALATTHVPLRKVAEHLSGEKIELAIGLAARACRDLGLGRARIGVCGLNPHAGEGGRMGDEEQTTIGPAVARMQEQRLDVVGPLSADALFHYAYQGDYDAVVAMYHDQGLAPLKMVAFDHGVNWTLGLPFIRTSPDHGTAYDIAGQGKANPSSMMAAINLAAQLAAAH